MWFRQVVGVLYPGFIVPFCFFPSPKKVSRACTWCACCKIFGDDEEEGWPGEHVYFLQDVFLVSFFSFFFICLRHSVICIVGQLELDRAFHRREFVSFLYAQRRAWRGCGSAASYLSHHTHCLFFSCFVEGRWWLGGGGVGVLRVAISLISTFWLFAGMVNSYVLLYFIIPFFSLGWFGLWTVVTFVVFYFLTLVVLVACPVSSPHLTRDVLTALMTRKISPCFFYTH